MTHSNDVLDATTSVGHAEDPKPGSISVCANCGHIAQFTDHGLEDTDLIDLKKHVSVLDGLILKKMSKEAAERFFQENGFYASTAFQEI